MKKLLFSLIPLFFWLTLSAQKVPQGMNYQAIARDNSGQILADREISIEIQLNADSPDGKAAYTERHYLKTNNLGLFNMIIGEGIPVYGTFSEVPWSQSDIWLTISLDENGGNNFQLLNSSRLLAVPYAFHAASAETLIIHEHQEKRRCPITGLPFWSILGNDNVTDTCHFIGTTIPEDLVFRTDSIERMRITAAGDIIIGGDLVVLGNVDVGIDLSVGNDASIGNNLDVTNNANIGGDLTVGGDGEFFNLNVLNDLSVGRDGAFTRDVSIGNDLDVSSDAQIDGAATIEGQLNANGRLIVTGGASGPDNNISSYPALIQGSNQGLAIKVNGNRNNDNNFISFWDNNGMHGRIEGQTNAELSLDPEYIFENSILVAQEGIAIADEVAALSSTTLCANAGGPCITAPIPSLITAASANLVVQTAQIVGYNTFRQTNIGVTYQSGAGDYAEWLPKANPEEAFQPGDIIGVKGGQISHKTTDAELLMVISHRPIVLGNMPPEEELSKYEKVAFMGQVPVKVLGRVKPGDYIIPSGRDDGTGIGLDAEKMKPEQYAQVVGIAWSASGRDGFNHVNVAVGLNANDLSKVVSVQQQQIQTQQEEINDLKTQLEQIKGLLKKMVPGFESAIDKKEPIAPIVEKKTTITKPVTNDYPAIVYNDISRKYLEEGIKLAEERLRSDGIDVDHHPFFKQIREDAAYKEAVLKNMMKKIREYIARQQQLETTMGN